MRTLSLAAVAAAVVVAAPAAAQDATATTDTYATTSTETARRRHQGVRVRALCRGARRLGAVRCRAERRRHAPAARANKLNGSLVEGIVGANVPLGAFFVGAEGNIAKGISGDIDWQYGAAGRFGLRAGESGLFYGKVGYQWVNFAKRADTTRRCQRRDLRRRLRRSRPKDIGLGGLTGNSGLRLRGEVQTLGWVNGFSSDAGPRRPLLIGGFPPA
ncbi:opacity protein [Sphingomonas sp. MMS24-JH45]